MELKHLTDHSDVVSQGTMHVTLYRHFHMTLALPVQYCQIHPHAETLYPSGNFAFCRLNLLIDYVAPRKASESPGFISES
jgi:hypothetical protein